MLNPFQHCMKLGSYNVGFSTLYEAWFVQCWLSTLYESMDLYNEFPERCPKLGSYNIESQHCTNPWICKTNFLNVVRSLFLTTLLFVVQCTNPWIRTTNFLNVVRSRVRTTFLYVVHCTNPWIRTTNFLNIV